MDATMVSQDVLAQVAALTARLDEQAITLAAQAEEIARLKATPLAAQATQRVTVAPDREPRFGRRGMLTKAVGATAAAALLTVASEAATAYASSRTTVLGANTSGVNYGLAASPSSSDPQALITNVPLATAFRAYGVIGVESNPGISPPDGAGVLGQANGFYGVIGLSSGGKGMYGQSVSSIGVHGVTSSASQPALRGDGEGVGVLGTATGAGVGLWGITVSGIGLLGTSTSGIGLSGSTSGNNVGVFGSADGPGMIGAIGLVGRSANGTGIVGQGAIAARFDGSVVVNGAFTVSGGPKSAAVRHPDGEYRRMYCQESPEPWFEDFGTATLTNGRAVVDLDPEFDAVVKGDDYLIFLTPEGNSNGLFISRKGPHRFVVEEQQGGKSTLAFSYRVVSRRRDAVGKRLEKVTLRSGKLGEPLKLPDVPIPARVPDVPPPSR